MNLYIAIFINKKKNGHQQTLHNLYSIEKNSDEKSNNNKIKIF